MKKTMTINAMIFLTAMPISGVFALLAILNGISPHDTGGSSLVQIVRYVFAPVASGIMTIETIQTIILAGPLILFLAAMTGATIKGWKTTSHILSGLASMSWTAIVLLDIYANAMP